MNEYNLRATVKRLQLYIGSLIRPITDKHKSFKTLELYIKNLVRLRADKRLIRYVTRIETGKLRDITKIYNKATIFTGQRRRVLEDIAGQMELGRTFIEESSYLYGNIFRYGVSDRLYGESEARLVAETFDLSRYLNIGRNCARTARLMIQDNFDNKTTRKAIARSN